MKKIYLHVLNSINVLGLIAPGVPALAELYNFNTISPEQVMSAEAVSTTTRSTTAMAEVSTIVAQEVLPEGVQVIQAVESDRHSKISDVQPASMASSRNQVTSVSQLSNVQPTDWVFLALQAVVKRYGCLAGYPNNSLRGNRTITRYEFAARVDACLSGLKEQIAALSGDDLATFTRLQAEFAAELATLRGRIDALEAQTTQLEASQFSPTTKTFRSISLCCNRRWL